MKKLIFTPVAFILLSLSLSAQEVDYRIYQSPVKNQINRGTCTAFAVLAALETFPGFPVDMSEQYLYYVAKSANYDKIDDYNQGAFLGYYIDALESSGTLSEVQVPYNPAAPIWNDDASNFEKFKKDIQGSLYQYLQLNAFAYKLSPNMYEYLLGDNAKNVELLKKRLDNGTRAIPVSYAMNPGFWSNHPASKENKIDPASFVQLSEGDKLIGFNIAKLLHGSNWHEKISNGTLNADYTNMNLRCDKGHAVAIVGYDENGFLIKNSWGTELFGDEGYGWISFDYHRLFAKENLLLFAGKVAVNDWLKPKKGHWKRQDFHLKSMPSHPLNLFGGERKRGISISLVYHGEVQMPSFSEVTYEIYNEDKQLIDTRLYSGDVFDYRSTGYENIILASNSLTFPKCHKVVVYFKTSEGLTFTNEYFNIEAVNKEHKPF